MIFIRAAAFVAVLGTYVALAEAGSTPDQFQLVRENSLRAYFDFDTESSTR